MAVVSLPTTHPSHSSFSSVLPIHCPFSLPAACSILSIEMAHRWTSSCIMVSSHVFFGRLANRYPICISNIVIYILYVCGWLNQVCPDAYHRNCHEPNNTPQTHYFISIFWTTPYLQNSTLSHFVHHFWGFW